MATEHVMVMKRSNFQSAGDYLSSTMARETLQIAWPNAEWLSRQQAEISEQWVQIIPCAVIQDESGRYAVFHRSTEPREDLSKKVSLLIGGHVEFEFGKGDALWNILLRSLLRELREEVDVHNPSVDGLIGLLVDNKSTAASRHVALVYRVRIREDISIKATEEFNPESSLSGKFLSKEQLRRRDFQWDPWSSLLLSIL